MNMKTLVGKLLGATLAVMGCGQAMEARLAGPTEPACGFLQSASGQRVSWKDNLPVKIHIANSWPREFIPAVQRAAAQWNNATSRFLLTVEIGGVDDVPARDRKNGLYWLKEWSESRIYEQAQTLLFFSASVPLDGDIKVDAKYFTYYDEANPGLGSYHLESLLVHEMGHLLGLAHAYKPPTVMAPFLSAYELRAEVTANDLQSIKCEYPK
jgi:predicted Zn-dependent protease